MTRTFPSVSYETVSRALSVIAILSAGIAVTMLLLPNPLTDVFFAGTMVLGVGFAVVGAIGAWTNRTPLVWVGAGLLAGLSILGLLSVGIVLAPAALALLGAAVCSQLAGPRTGVREAVLANPPTDRTVVQKILVGVGTVVAGLALIHVGAFTRELFGSCASETFSCALETTNRGAVAVTVLGLGAVSSGAWLLWRQAYVTLVLASAQTQ